MLRIGLALMVNAATNWYYSPFIVSALHDTAVHLGKIATVRSSTWTTSERPNSSASRDPLIGHGNGTISGPFGSRGSHGSATRFGQPARRPAAS